MNDLVIIQTTQGLAKYLLADDGLGSHVSTFTFSNYITFVLILNFRNGFDVALIVLLDLDGIIFQVQSMGAVIGYDARFNSSRWAKLAAGVFLKFGFKVRLFSTITPTPLVSFTVVQKKACIGIMITASHNPKEDNGYKVFWRNGAQV